MRKILRLANTCTNVYRLMDFLVKVVLVLLAFYFNWFANEYWLGKTLEVQKKQVNALQQTLQRKIQLQNRASQVDLHIHEGDRLSKRALHDVVKTGLATIDNVDIVSSNIEKVSAKDTGLVSYESFPMDFYEVNVLLRGRFQDIENFYYAVNQSYPHVIFWKDVVVDASKYPQTLGAISFYVLAK